MNTTITHSTKDNLIHIPKDNAALFIDYENLYYHLKEEYHDPATLFDVVLEVIRNLRSFAGTTLNLDTIIIKAYADFERISTVPLGSLYLMGIDTHNVLGTEHKNAADMRLCVDLMEILYTRQDIKNYVLIAGDRDYIPIVQHLRKQGKIVRVVAFRESLSGDLLEIIGKNNLVEAKQFINAETETTLIKHRYNTIHSKGIKVVGKIDLPEKKVIPIHAKENIALKAELSKSIKLGGAAPVVNTFNDTKKIENTTALSCLKLLVEFTQENNLKEVWLTPFLRRLTDTMHLLADYERKEAIANLKMNGAIAVIQKEGENHSFSVIVINYNHPTVIKLMP